MDYKTSARYPDFEAHQLVDPQGCIQQYVSDVTTELFSKFLHFMYNNPFTSYDIVVEFKFCKSQFD